MCCPFLSCSGAPGFPALYGGGVVRPGPVGLTAFLSSLHNMNIRFADYVRFHLVPRVWVSYPDVFCVHLPGFNGASCPATRRPGFTTVFSKPSSLGPLAPIDLPVL